MTELLVATGNELVRIRRDERLHQRCLAHAGLADDREVPAAVLGQ